MRLAPNPATTEVMVTVEGLTESGGTIMGFDAQGRVVWQWSSVQRPTSCIYVSNLPSGLYQVRLKTENGAGGEQMVVVSSLIVIRH